MYDRILSAIDSTPHAHTVIAHTQYLARLTQARVHILHVYSMRTVHAGLPVIAAAAAGVNMAGVPPAELTHGAHEWVDQAVDRLLTAGVIAAGEVLDAHEDRAAQLIVQRAQDLAIQLVVVGAQYRRRLLASLRPTVAERVCHEPRCPILIVP